MLAMDGTDVPVSESRRLIEVWRVVSGPSLDWGWRSGLARGVGYGTYRAKQGARVKTLKDRRPNS